MNIIKLIKDLVYNLKTSVLELLFLRKQDKSKDVNVDLLTDSDNIEEMTGRLTNDRRFLHIHDLGRLIIKPRIFRRKGKKTLIIGEKSHGRLDMDKIQNVSMAQSYKILAKFKKAAYFDRTDFNLVDSETFYKKRKELFNGTEPFAEFTVSGQIDLTLFDNDISPDFMADSFLCTTSNQLNILADLPNYKLLLIIGMCLLLGFALGNANMFFWMFLYNWFT